MCFFGRPRMPAPPPPLPPAPPPPAAPAPPAPVPKAKVKPVNPAVREAQSKLGTKKGQKGSTADLRIKKTAKTINPGSASSKPINTP